MSRSTQMNTQLAGNGLHKWGQEPGDSDLRGGALTAAPVGEPDHDPAPLRRNGDETPEGHMMLRMMLRTLTRKGLTRMAEIIAKEGADA